MPKCSSSFTITDLNDGATGPQGPQGPKGDKGDTGATGAQGPQGNKGDTGATGNGISSITYYYAKTTTQNAPSSVTSTTIPTVSAIEKYLWQKEVIAFTDGTSKSTVALIGVYGDTGSKGDKGDTGSTGAQGPQGNKGDKGDKGDTGNTGPQGPQGNPGSNGTSVSISSTSITYQASNSGTVTPTGNWSSTVPAVSKGQYLWTRTIVNYSPSGSTTSYSVSYIGVDGERGPQGDDGNAIASVTIAYGVSDSSENGPSQWYDDESDVTWNEGQWLWTRRTTTYTDGNDSDVEVTRQIKPVKVLEWDFILNVETRTYDLRNPSHSVDLVLKPKIKGYSDNPTVTYNGTVIAVSDQGTYRKTVLDSDTNDGIFRMYSSNLDVSKTVKAIDITVYRQKFPASSSAPSNAIAGDFYYDLATNIPKQLTSGGTWVESTDHTVLLGTIDDAFSNPERVTAAVYARYAYFHNIIAKYIDVESLFADDITVAGTIKSNNYVADSSGFLIDGGTGKAEFVGAKMTDCTITGNLTANDVQAVVLKTVNANVAGSAVSSSDMLDRNSPYYLLSDALSLVKNAFTSNSKANLLIDFSASNSSFSFNGTSYPKAMYVTANGTEITLKSNQSLSWPTVTDRQDIILTSFSVSVPIVSVLKITGTLAQRYYKTNSRQSYTYYTDYAYWENPSTRTGVVYVNSMNDGYSDESEPSSPSDGDTYTTYDSVSASNYVLEYEYDATSSTKPSTSWSYWTSSGIRYRKKASNVTSTSGGGYEYHMTVEAASTYWQSYYVHTYHEGTQSHTGYTPSADNATGGYQTAQWQYSFNNSSWTTLSGSTATVDISSPNQTVYIRQIIAKPTATYYLANGTDTTTTTCPWGAAKTNGSASSVTYNLSKFSNGYVHAFNSSNALALKFSPGDADNPINSAFLVKLSGSTWFTKDSSDSTWLNKQYYKVKATPFSSEVNTSSFSSLSVSYSVYEGSSGAVSHSVTSGSTVIFSNASNCVTVDGIVYVSKNNFYRSASASVTPNSATKGVYVQGIQPQNSGIDIGSSNNRFDDVFATTFNGTSVTASGQISANTFNATSSRRFKRNIRKTSVDALKMLKRVEIVDFKYRNDRRKVPHIGFIAEDTDPLLSTPKQDSMDIGNCIGLLLKAVQELSDEIDRLKEK